MANKPILPLPVEIETIPLYGVWCGEKDGFWRHSKALIFTTPHFGYATAQRDWWLKRDRKWGQTDPLYVAVIGNDGRPEFVE